MKRFGLWATLVMAGLMVITGFLTGVLPGVFHPPAVRPQVTGIGTSVS